jgi:hypothetical protein
MQELQDRVQGAQWFTKMDLKSGFHLIRIREDDELKTGFRTRYGLYEYLIMLFGLPNAPSTFQHMMNHIFWDMIDMGLVASMDDLLIYADTVERHNKIVQELLRRLTKNCRRMIRDTSLASALGFTYHTGTSISADTFYKYPLPTQENRQTSCNPSTGSNTYFWGALPRKW